MNPAQKRGLLGGDPGRSLQGQFSPNGKFIAFTSDESGQNEIYVLPTQSPTEYKKVSIHGGHSPRWSQDGKELFFVSPDADAEMMVVDIKLDPVFHAGVQHRLFPLKSADPNDLADYDVRPDGQQFLIFMRQRSAEHSPITVVLNW